MSDDESMYMDQNMDEFDVGSDEEEVYLTDESDDEEEDEDGIMLRIEDPGILEEVEMEEVPVRRTTGSPPGIQVQHMRHMYEKAMSQLDPVTATTYTLSLLSEDEKQRRAEVQVGHTTRDQVHAYGTLHDPRMGSIRAERLCETCHQGMKQCPGHYGIITLPEPIYHPLFLSYTIQVLSSVCPNCATPYITKSDFRRHGLEQYKGLQRLQKIAKLSTGCTTCTCTIVENGVERLCRGESRKYNVNSKEQRNVILYTVPKSENKEKNWPLQPKDASTILKAITRETADMLGFKAPMHPANFIVWSILVPPSCVRPLIEDSGSGSWMAAGDTELQTIIHNVREYNMTLHLTTERREKLMKDIYFYYRALLVNDKAGRNGRTTQSLTTRLKGKTGLYSGIRGRRGDFAGRSVITGNNTFGFGYVGVPKFMQHIITLPVYVADFNRNWLQTMFRQGDIPYIIQKSGKAPGKRIFVNQEMRRNYKLQIGDIVRRILINGDYVMFGRQPSLHAGSLMGFRVIIVKELTFQFNLAHTKSFNADFDGDEMTIYVPQTPEEYAEVSELAMARNMIISRHTLTPTQGAIFNALTSIMLMTQPDTILQQADFNDTLMLISNVTALDDLFARGESVGVQNFYSGRMLFSSILPDDLYYYRGEDQGEDVHILRGILVSGMITVKDIGTKRGSLVQVIFNDYGYEEAERFINDVSFIGERYLTGVDFTVGPKDLIPQTVEEMTLREMRTKARELNVPDVEKMNKNELLKVFKKHKLPVPVYKSLQEELEKAWDDVQLKFQEVHTPRKDPEEERERQDRILKIFQDYTNLVSKLAHKYAAPKNAFNLMMNAKGSLLNLQRILASTAFQSYRGGIIENTLDMNRPGVFAPAGSSDPRSLGLCKSSFTEGLTPQEAYAHSIGGREGLADTSTQTAVAGRSTHNLIKSLGGWSVSPFQDIRYLGKILDFGLPFAPEFQEMIFIGGEPTLTPLNIDRIIGSLNVRAGFVGHKPLPPVENNEDLRLHMVKPDIELLLSDKMTEVVDEEGRRRPTAQVIMEKATTLRLYLKDQDRPYVYERANYYEPIREILDRVARKTGVSVDELTIRYQDQILDPAKILADYLPVSSNEERMQLNFDQGAPVLKPGVRSRRPEEWGDGKDQQWLRTYLAY